MAEQIRVGTDFFAIVDDEDVELVSGYKWRPNRQGERIYAFVCKGKRGSEKTIQMHRLILGFPSGIIDHANGNCLDNRKSNLRICTNSQNQQNKRMSGGHSRFKGVSKLRQRDGSLDKKWRAYITVNKKRLCLGTHDTEEEAAAAYNRAAVENFGEFARLNIFERTEDER